MGPRKRGVARHAVKASVARVDTLGQSLVTGFRPQLRSDEIFSHGTSYEIWIARGL
jgi:hypothetical protein